MTLKIKDPGSALTHFIAMILALCAASPLIIKAAQEPGRSHVLALTIFITSMVLLYAASTVYHTHRTTGPSRMIPTARFRSQTATSTLTATML